MYPKVAFLSRVIVGLCVSLLLIVTLAPFSISRAAQTPTECPGTQPARLIVGSFAVVTPGAPNNVRSTPSTNAEVVTQIFPGEDVFVTASPTCANGYLWWPVKTLNGFSGWTAESSATSYFLAPTSSAIEHFGLTAGAAAIIVNYKGISFLFPPALGKAVEAKTVFEVQRQADSPSDDYPQHIAFALSPIDSKNLYNTPSLSVYKTDAISTHGTDAPIFENFRQFLARHPDLSTIDRIPVYPSVHADQVFLARAGYVTFQGGSGIRFLTHYAQSIEPLTGDRLVYTYLGLSDDGKNYVVAEVPLKTGVLNGNDALMPDLSDPQIGALYPAYIKRTAAKLESAKPTDFAPSLSDLDKLVNSLAIQ